MTILNNKGIRQMKKTRVFVLTDIENEPDDAMSLVRFLVYANQWDIEGLVATTSIHLKDRTAKHRIEEIVTAYGKVRDQLEKHEQGFPTADQLKCVISEGLPVYGFKGVGKDKDSAGSERLTQAIKRQDHRPLWVLCWGGTNVLAQALWKLKQICSPEEFDHYIAQLRVFTTSDQDDTGPWLRKTFPQLFYITSPGFHDGGAYHYATWSGISGDRFHGRFTGANFDIVDNPWLEENIRCKGPLGAKYPESKYLMEGDSPTFLYLIHNGLGNPEHPEWGSWGGRYELYTPRMQKYFLEPETRPIYSDCMDEVLGIDEHWHTSNHATIWRFREAFQNDFSARMDWTIKEVDEANHPPVAQLNHPNVLSARPGDKIELSAKGSFDPDGDQLSYHWFYYPEAGSFTFSHPTTPESIKIHHADQEETYFIVPSENIFRTGTIHIILVVTDNGTPALTRYQRVIIHVN